MSKLLYCIRHGLAEHNINYHKYGVQTFYDPNYVDTKLLTHGFKQASELRETWEDINNIELVIVSPLRRTLQTANELFKGINIPIIALECCREYPMGKQTCNKRSERDYLQKMYPHINFDDLTTNLDTLWLPHREESIDELNVRIHKLKQFVLDRPETNIAFVNHSSFIGQLKDNHIRYLENNEQELKHCFPYLVKL